MPKTLATLEYLVTRDLEGYSDTCARGPRRVPAFLTGDERGLGGNPTAFEGGEPAELCAFPLNTLVCSAKCAGRGGTGTSGGKGHSSPPNATVPDVPAVRCVSTVLAEMADALIVSVERELDLSMVTVVPTVPWEATDPPELPFDIVGACFILFLWPDLGLIMSDP